MQKSSKHPVITVYPAFYKDRISVQNILQPTKKELVFVDQGFRSQGVLKVSRCKKGRFHVHPKQCHHPYALIGGRVVSEFVSAPSEIGLR